MEFSRIEMEYLLEHYPNSHLVILIQGKNHATK